MLSYFLLIVGFLLLFVVGLSYLAKADPRILGKAVRYIGGMVLLAVAVALVARGLIFYAIPIGILGYSLLQGRTPFSSTFPGSANKSTGQQSTVRTDTIEMRLDHDSGDMEGMVLRGRYANRMLSDLELNDLIELWSECRQSDDQAAKLLEAYIDRKHPDWREAAGHTEGEDESSRGASGGPMGFDEAYEILGLAPGASATEIRRAHRRLMKKLHPDQGGSTYLASKINEAKDLLLKR